MEFEQGSLGVPGWGDFGWSRGGEVRMGRWGGLVGGRSGGWGHEGVGPRRGGDPEGVGQRNGGATKGWGNEGVSVCLCV